MQLSSAEKTTPTHKRWVRKAVATMMVTSFFGFGTAVAQAQEDVYVDHAHPVAGFSGNWKPAVPYLVAQPFIPESTGYGFDMTVYLSDIDGDHVFTSAAIHTFPLGEEEISVEPLDGGVGTLTFADDADENGLYPATVSFPEQPALQSGVRYALVIDPTSPGGTASFKHSLGDVPDLNAWSTQDGVWSGAFTGRLFFELRMTENQRVVEVDPVPEAPEQEESKSPQKSQSPTKPLRVETSAH